MRQSTLSKSEDKKSKDSAFSNAHAVLERAHGLLKVTTLLSGAYTVRRAAQIIVNEGFRVLNAHNGDLVLLNEKGEFETVITKGYPEDFVKEWPKVPQSASLLSNEVIQTKKPCYVTDVASLPKKYKVAASFLGTSGAKSLVILPLTIKNKVIGIVQFTFTTPQVFNHEEKVFMNTLANQCAQAFERVFALENLKNAKEELEVILKNVADGIIAQDKNYKLIYCNQTALQFLSCSTISQLRNINRDPMPIEIRDEQNNFVSHETLFHQKISPAQSLAPMTVQIVNKNTGAVRWLLIKTTGIYHKNSSSPLIINTLQDITKTKELEQRKDDFISVASHELKTPLTSLKLYLDLLSKEVEKGNHEETMASLQKMKDQTHRLQRLITDLLDVSRIQESKLDLQLESFPLGELIMDIIEGLRLDISGHDIVFHGTSPLMVRADKFRIYQVITNLLTNAAKYSPVGTKITISLKQENTYALVSVKDAGIGIPQNQQKKIFEKLYQVNDTQKRIRSGFGMGLYIAAEIIKQHGGEIWVKSTKGKGSTFFFTLPLVKEKKSNKV